MRLFSFTSAPIADLKAIIAALAQNSIPLQPRYVRIDWKIGEVAVARIATAEDIIHAHVRN